MLAKERESNGGGSLRGYYEGTYKSTQKSTRAEFAHVLEFEGGRIARFIQYTDTFKVAEAMGKA